MHTRINGRSGRRRARFSGLAPGGALRAAGNPGVAGARGRALAEEDQPGLSGLNLADCTNRDER